VTAPGPGTDQESYVEAVLQVVEAIPPGRVASYGDIAEAVGRGGPRQVGHVMALHGAAVPWWRVVRADGSPPRGHERRALELLAAEGTPLRGGRVVLPEGRATLAAEPAEHLDDATSPDLRRRFPLPRNL
jgi:alkylated DNA nucleotide flippase Atl1